MAQIRVANPASIGEGELQVLAEGLLLLRYQGQLHCIENKCGHFGVPLADGELRDGAIVCRHHGISFCLSSGEVVNRPWENCDRLRVYPVSESADAALIDLG
ncbi:MAG: Rieske 2Fe-2S domain-containing protein [Gammaproteobacteria bacterium]|nr:Rieske 2Fe-2S domain-containing protein [Gammaproteobacteria bacterium]